MCLILGISHHTWWQPPLPADQSTRWLGFLAAHSHHLHSEPLTDADILPRDRRPRVRLKVLSTFQTSRLELKWLITAREIKQPLDVSVWAACNNPKLIKRQAKKGKKHRNERTFPLRLSFHTWTTTHSDYTQRLHKILSYGGSISSELSLTISNQAFFSFSDTKLNLD